MSEIISIEEYLRGKVGFDVSDSALTSILIDRKVNKGADVSVLDQKTKDLAYADLLMWGATNPSSYTGSKNSDGGWTHTDASKTITTTDKKEWRKQADAIYREYGDKKYKSRVRKINLNDCW